MIQRLYDLTSALRAIVVEWRRRARSRGEIAALEGGTIHDLGVSRGQLRFEAKKPFWRA